MCTADAAMSNAAGSWQGRNACSSVTIRGQTELDVDAKDSTSGMDPSALQQQRLPRPTEQNEYKKMNAVALHIYIFVWNQLRVYWRRCSNCSHALTLTER